jgi:hypothetical protein
MPLAASLQRKTSVFAMSGLLLIEVGRRESADTGPDDDQVVLFVEVGVLAGLFPSHARAWATS